jgi:hypothetical protein
MKQTLASHRGNDRQITFHLKLVSAAVTTELDHVSVELRPLTGPLSMPQTVHK